jgi:hypothetical protein
MNGQATPSGSPNAGSQTQTYMLIAIMLALWLIAAVLWIGFFKFVSVSQAEKPCVGMHTEQKSDVPTDNWIIDHPFGKEVLVQLIPDNKDLTGGSLPYVERLIRTEGRVDIEFVKPVSNYTVIIVGVYR